eukprot:gene32999-39914_t
MELVCTYPHHYGYQAGEMFIIYLKGYRIDKTPGSNDLSSLIMFAQIHGHIQIDRKWISQSNKLASLIEEDDDNVVLDRPSQLPANPSGMDSNSTCFLASAKVTLSPSHLESTGMISLHLDFSHNEQRCEAVRVSVVMQEVFDATQVIQEKVVVSSMYYTDDAESIHINLPVPADISPTTQTLLFEIKYALLLEYYLDQASTSSSLYPPPTTQPTDASHPPSLPPACSFSLPLSLHAPRLHGTHDESDAMTKNDWVLMCLRSDITRKPLGDPQLVSR